MISRILISASAGIILFFGSVHLAYTFLTHKFSPTEKQLETAMKQVAPRISREATMWKVWIGIHVSHSMGLVMFGLIYGYLALSRTAGAVFSLGTTWATGGGSRKLVRSSCSIARKESTSWRRVGSPRQRRSK